MFHPRKQYDPWGEEELAYIAPRDLNTSSPTRREFSPVVPVVSEPLVRPEIPTGSPLRREVITIPSPIQGDYIRGSPVRRVIYNDYTARISPPLHEGFPNGRVSPAMARLNISPNVTPTSFNPIPPYDEYRSYQEGPLHYRDSPVEQYYDKQLTDEMRYLEQSAKSANDGFEWLDRAPIPPPPPPTQEPPTPVRPQPVARKPPQTPPQSPPAPPKKPEHDELANYDPKDPDNIHLLLDNVAKNNLDRVKYFISRGLGPNVSDYDRRTPLHLAAAEGHVEMVKLLIDAKANPNPNDRFGNTPFDEALRSGNQEIIILLSNLRAKIGVNNSHRFTFLQAATEGRYDLCRQLLDHKMDPNTVDYDGKSALLLTVSEGHLPVAVLLLDRGADPLLEDRFGMSPAEEARRRGQRTGADDLVALFQIYSPIHELTDTGRMMGPIMAMWQLFLIVLFALTTKYDATVGDGAIEGTEKPPVYPFYQDVHVMIFIGFGYLMTFLRRYSYSSLSFNFMLAVFVIQWYTLVSGYWHNAFNSKWERVHIELKTMLLADFAAGSVLITFGGVLGKVSSVQLLVLAALEVVFYSLNEAICLRMGVADIGGTYVIHMFGAYFGLAASVAMVPMRLFKSQDNCSVYHSDFFAMIGTIFLWLFWPSFNGAPGSGPQQHRAVINTLYSITASCFTAFLFSLLLRADKKFNMVDIQNSTLAGGVAIGACADMMIHPAAALGIGAFSGMVSVFGYVYIQGWLEKYWYIDDTCGINNLHGMPSLIGAFAAVFASQMALETDYGPSFGLTFPVRAETGRGNGHQALIQFLFIFITLAISTSGGLVSGWLCRHFLPGVIDGYTDKEHWRPPEQETPYYFDFRGEILRANVSVQTKKRMALPRRFSSILLG